MMRTQNENTIYTFNPTFGQVKVPVVAASIMDMINVVRRGPDNINELRQFMQDYLGNNSGMLPAILEPIGWSYNGLGNVLDESGNPIAGAQVISVCKVGSKNYYTKKSTTSAADGKFTLERIFPGNNYLRVYYNGGSDSADISSEINWENKTNQTVNLGNIVVKKTTAPNYKYLWMSFVGDHEFIDNSQPNTFGDLPPMPTSLDILSTSFYGNLNWSGNYFSLTFSESSSYTMSLDGEIDSDGSKIISLNYKYIYVNSEGETKEEYKIANVPLASSDWQATTFQKTGSDIASSITVPKWYHYKKAATMLNYTIDMEYVKTNFDANTSLTVKFK